MEINSEDSPLDRAARKSNQTFNPRSTKIRVSPAPHPSASGQTFPVFTDHAIKEVKQEQVKPLLNSPKSSPPKDTENLFKEIFSDLIKKELDKKLPEVDLEGHYYKRFEEAYEKGELEKLTSYQYAGEAKES